MNEAGENKRAKPSQATPLAEPRVGEAKVMDHPRQETLET